ncbi:MAG TPA: 16S rRNA (cytidine(1402)-2'-O)-methyltransferase [Syntrophorhabdaceae bacterium]|nr:16S rRNA (cytidine(1402)-2'-O)-methyltransferase [Syntrophorhabdaceae bacterium]
MDLNGILYVVATPIGNLKDITLRAIEVLGEVDFVVAESSARALKLLNHLAIRKSIVSINSYNEERKASQIAQRLRKGARCALITSAGTPGVSDPGNYVVRACYEEGVEVKAVPGPSAAVGAVSISGLFADRFLFFGFMPQKKGKQKKILKELVALPYPMVFYESPRRIKGTLETIREVFGNRQAVIFKEMTKVHEKTVRGSIDAILESLPEDWVKGEFTIIVEGSKKEVVRDNGGLPDIGRGIC